MEEIEVKEVWKRIPDTHIEVSSQGRIRNYVTGHLRKPILSKRSRYPLIVINYLSTKLRKSYRVHRLILQTFDPRNDPNLEVNHINGDRSDNRLSNLCWVTRQENMLHAKENYLNRTTYFFYVEEGEETLFPEYPKKCWLIDGIINIGIFLNIGASTAALHFKDLTTVVNYRGYKITPISKSSATSIKFLMTRGYDLAEAYKEARLNEDISKL